MADFKDKLTKKKLKKVDPIRVICEAGFENDFYNWISHFNPLEHRIYSLRRLARIYVSENNEALETFESLFFNDEETMRIAKINVWEDE